MYTPIRDYGIIGNLRSAVLVSRHGSIDWAPAPFIDSPSVFGALLDDVRGGRWRIAPAATYESEQFYEEDTNVLVTRFRTETGVAEVTDFLPPEEETTFVPAEDNTTFRLHRRITCSNGSVTLQHLFAPAFDYARGETRLEAVGDGILARCGQMHGRLTTEHAMEITSEGANGTIELEAGNETYAVFRYNHAHAVSAERDTHEHHRQELDETRRFWRDWVHRCDLAGCPAAGPWHEYVQRSLLALKILFFEPVGTVAAAPTTSLPEVIGGVRNWDYRFVWLRDAAFVFQAMFRMGHVTEAREYIEWLLRQCTEPTMDAPEDLQIMYGLRGQRDLVEEELSHLSGYRDSQPVRIGNAAHQQQQWDTYGSVFDLVWQYHQLVEGQPVTANQWTFLRELANYVTRIWREPDEGLWEVRGEAHHFTYSKVMCWVALDRACKLADAYGFSGETSTWRTERDAIHAEVCERGWSDERGAFVQSLDGTELDAAVLQMPAVGFIAGDDPRMVSTIRTIQQELGCGDGLLYRYSTDDGLPGREGAFMLASFWLVDALVAAGEHEEAQTLFTDVCRQSNHLNLFAEEIDPHTGEFLGNFPQAYTHVGLINSAATLTRMLRQT